MRGSARSAFAGPVVSPAPPGYCGCRKSPGAPAPSIGGDGRALGATTEKYSSRRVADELDDFVLVISAGSRGWRTATPDDLSYFLCYLDTQGKGTKVVHESSCPGGGRVGDNACREGSLCARRFAAESLRNGFASKKKMVNQRTWKRGLSLIHI